MLDCLLESGLTCILATLARSVSMACILANMLFNAPCQRLRDADGAGQIFLNRSLSSAGKLCRNCPKIPQMRCNRRTRKHARTKRAHRSTTSGLEQSAARPLVVDSAMACASALATMNSGYVARIYGDLTPLDLTWLRWMQLGPVRSR